MSFLPGLKNIGEFFSTKTAGLVIHLAISIAAVAMMTINPAVGVILSITSLFIGLSQQSYADYVASKSVDAGIKDEGFLENVYAKVDALIPIVYGLCRVGGNIVFQKTTGSNNKNLYTAMTLAEGKTGNIESIMLDDVVLNPIKKFEKKTSKEWIIEVGDSNITNIKGSFYVDVLSYNWLRCKNDIYTIYKLSGYLVPTAVNLKNQKFDFEVAVGSTQRIVKQVNGFLNVVEYTLYIADVSAYLDTTTNKVYLKISLKDYLGKEPSLCPGFDKDIGYADSTISIYIKKHPNKSSINNLFIEGVSYDNGNTWSTIKEDKINNMAFLYFDGTRLYKWNFSNSTITWSSVTQYDALFKEFVDAGFIVGEDYTNADKYDVAFNKLVSNKVSLILSKYIYKSNVWGNIPKLTVVLNGKMGVTPFNTQEHLIRNPVDILYNYLFNKDYGLGMDVSKLDLELDENGNAIGGSWKIAYDYCESMGFVFDGVINSGKVDDIIKQILKHFKGELIYKYGKYHLIIKDLPFEIANGLVYPNVVEINEDNKTFNISYPDLSTMYDRVVVSFIDSTTNFKVNKVEIPDLVELNRPVNELNISIYGAEYSQAKYLGIYYLERSRLATTVTFSIGQEYIDLEVGQCFRLTNKSFGIEEQWFRCTGKTINKDGTITISAIIESEELYDKEYDEYIYDIDLTQLPSALDILPPVENLIVSEKVEIGANGEKFNYILLDWDDVAWADKYQVYISDDGGITWRFACITNTSQAKIPVGLSKGYLFKVIPVSKSGVVGDLSLYPSISYSTSNSLLVPNNSILSSHLVDNSVITEKIATEAVTSKLCYYSNLNSVSLSKNATTVIIQLNDLLLEVGKEYLFCLNFTLQGYTYDDPNIDDWAKFNLQVLAGMVSPDIYWYIFPPKQFFKFGGSQDYGTGFSMSKVLSPPQTGSYSFEVSIDYYVSNTNTATYAEVLYSDFSILELKR